MVTTEFFSRKRVFLTGHTGFKGSWLCRILTGMGAQVTGFSLAPPTTEPNLFSLCKVEEKMVQSVIGDIRDFEALWAAFERAEPEIVIHMAAQPIVRESYKNPLYTYETNVMGTANLLECVRRKSDTVRSVLNVTTDKVYENQEWHWGYRETDRLNGYDPYSNSKSCSELVTSSYSNSFLAEKGISVSTARAGNVIGGGDFSTDRIVPDIIRAAEKNEKVILRNPNSVRPYQHVLEPLFAYLMIVQRQYGDKKFADCYNVGPDDEDCVTTGALADLFCEAWGEGLTWEQKGDSGPHEAGFLKLDCAKLKSTFGWKPHTNIRQAVQMTVDWTREYLAQGDVGKVMDRQIDEFFRKGFC